MKKLLLIAALMAVVSHVQAQGYFNFSNSGRNAPIYIDKVGGTLAGAGYLADYAYFKGTTTDQSQLTLVGKSEGAALNNGVFFGGQQILDGYVGNISVQIRAWSAASGSTFAAAEAAGGAVGRGNIIQINLPDSSASPKPTMASMIGIQSFALVPEPSTIALGVIGLGALLFRRRK